jgi:hypothetical protein
LTTSFGKRTADIAAVTEIIADALGELGDMCREVEHFVDQIEAIPRL